MITFVILMMNSLLYIDPGSSSMIVQMLVAGALGIVFFLKNIWNFIKSFFVANKKNELDEKDDTI